MKNWKTTAAAALSAFMAATGPISAFLGAIQEIQSQIPGHAPANYTLAIVGAGLTCAAAIARLWIGLIQKDGLTPQQIGGIAITSVKTGAASAVIPPEIPAPSVIPAPSPTTPVTK